MSRELAQLYFYSEEKTIQVPLAELDRIIEVMKFYKVTHIIPKVNMHPALEPLVEGEIPGFKLVHDKGLDIYEIDYAVLPSMNLVIQYFKQELNKKEWNTLSKQPIESGFG